MGTAPPLSQGVGYGICLGFGAAFSVITTLLVWLNARYGGSKVTSESFNTAGRTVKIGMIAAVVCSQWTWAATLLQSSNVAWQYGVSGPFWYGAGACVQILLFGILSIEIKRKAPGAHTVCEIIRARWGGTAHGVFLWFCLLTNVLVTAMLLLGGAATIAAMTGMPTMVAAFLIPIGIMAYTYADGLAATFLSNYLHTVLLHGVLIVFIAAVYVWPSTKLGSVRDVYDAIIGVNAMTVQQCSDMGLTACGPVSGNRHGTYLTMFSSGGSSFALINIIGNFGTVFVDQSYWQSAIAARPSAAVKGYLLGGLCWFAIPFALATSLGLATLALKLPITAEQANAGLVPIASSVELLGPAGGVLMLAMIFLAVTSCGSAELIAVSSLLTYDVYHTYINPKASGKQLLRVSRGCVLGFGLIMGALAALLELVGLQLGYVYLLMGVLVGSAVFPISSCLLWSKVTASAAISGAIGGQVAGIVAWLCTTYAKYHDITLVTTGDATPMLVGNLVAIGLSAVITIVVSRANPDSYDWSSTRALSAVQDDEDTASTHTHLPPEETGPEALGRAKAFVLRWGLLFTALMLVIWPALSLPAGAPFSLSYFGLWVWVGIAWGAMSSVIITLLPLYESADAIYQVLSGIWSSLTGRDTRGKQLDDSHGKDQSQSTCICVDTGLEMSTHSGEEKIMKGP